MKTELINKRDELMGELRTLKDIKNPSRFINDEISKKTMRLIETLDKLNNIKDR